MSWYLVVPRSRPLATSCTTKGSMWPSAWPLSAVSMYAASSPGAGTDVTRRVQSSPSRAAAASSGACRRSIGSSRMPLRSRVTGSGLRIAAGLSAVVPLHEDQLLEQRHVLFVLEQRAHQRRHGHLVVLALQRFQRDVL